MNIFSNVCKMCWNSFKSKRLGLEVLCKEVTFWNSVNGYLAKLLIKSSMSENNESRGIRFMTSDALDNHMAQRRDYGSDTFLNTALPPQ